MTLIETNSGAVSPGKETQDRARGNVILHIFFIRDSELGLKIYYNSA